MKFRYWVLITIVVLAVASGALIGGAYLLDTWFSQLFVDPNKPAKNVQVKTTETGPPPEIGESKQIITSKPATRPVVHKAPPPPKQPPPPKPKTSAVTPSHPISQPSKEDVRKELSPQMRQRLERLRRQRLKMEDEMDARVALIDERLKDRIDEQTYVKLVETERTFLQAEILLRELYSDTLKNKEEDAQQAMDLLWQRYDDKLKTVLTPEHYELYMAEEGTSPEKKP